MRSCGSVWILVTAMIHVYIATVAVTTGTAATATTSCVTGATGFLASELVALLLERGHTVHATVRSLANPERVAYLRELPGAASKLQLQEADLLAEGSFDACVAGAQYVFHTASPFVTSGITDPQSQLIAPALNGTRNVFASIERAGLKPRVVVTSSMAAVMGALSDEKNNGQCFDEDDWNNSSEADGGGLDSYRYSKLVAEREAWKRAAELGLQLSTINPSFIIGPPRTPRVDGESLRNMQQALQGETPHRGDTPMIDVRDCAAAHIAAATLPAGAGKRFLTTSAQLVPRGRVVELLHQAYPQWDIPRLAHPDDDGAGALNEWVGWQDGEAYFCSKNLASIGIELRDPEGSLLDMAEAMLAHGVVQPKPRQKDEL